MLYFKRSAFLCFLLMFSRASFGAGYATGVPSAAGMGTAYAGQVTGSHNISNMFINPAAITQLSGHQLLLDNTYLVTDTTIKSGGTASSTDSVNYDLSGNGNAGIHGDNNAVVPSFYGVHSLQSDLKLGLSVTSPWGLSTRYRDGWLGRYYALESDMRTLNIAPVIAYQVNDVLSIGGGLQIQYMEALLSQAVDFAYLSRVTAFPDLAGNSPATDIHTELSGSDWGAGYKLGLLFEPAKRTKIGFGYRSKIKHTLKGENDFTVPSGISYATGAGQFIDTDAEVDLTAPAAANLGISQYLSADLELVVEVEWNDWSQMDRLVVKHDNASQPDSVTAFEWHDSWYYALGLNYKLNPRLTLRGGLAHEQSPIPNLTRAPGIPIGDKTLLGFGASYMLDEHLTFDASYMHIMIEDTSTNLSEVGGKGDLLVDYDMKVDLFGASLSYAF